MSEIIWILDPSSGGLVVEGLTAAEAAALAGDLLPAARAVDCARPLPQAQVTLPAPAASGGVMLRVSSIYHGSVTEGPGRRSVAQLQGCVLHCNL